MTSPPANRAPPILIASGAMKGAASATRSATPDLALIQRPSLVCATLVTRLRPLSTVRDDCELVFLVLWIILTVDFKVILILSIVIPVGCLVCICATVFIVVFTCGKAASSTSAGKSNVVASPYPPAGSPYPPAGSPYPPAGSPYPPVGSPYPPAAPYGAAAPPPDPYAASTPMMAVYTADSGAAAVSPPPNYADASQGQDVKV